MLSKQEVKILLNDVMLQELNITKEDKFNPIYGEIMTQTKVEKFVYKKHNEAFCNPKGEDRPKRKCIFYLHAGKTSSYVEIYNLNKEVIFDGNSLWSSNSSETKEDHLNFIRLLHSVDDVIGKFGGKVPEHIKQDRLI